jgi:nucleotide-binding universal stress UspA family protein
MIMPTYPVGSVMGDSIERQNLERRRQAEEMAQMIRTEAERLGVLATVEVLAGEYYPPALHLIPMARVSDVCVAQAPQAAAPLQRDMLVEVLFGSGVPLLVVPASWNGRSAIGHAIVAWDGNACAARAVRDALPLLVDAAWVELVSIVGEKDISTEATGADIARHLSRHCREASVNVLPVFEDGVAATLFAHARLSKSDLLVMGGYGHSRLQEFVLGGATRDALEQIDLPTLLSH